MDYSYDLLGDNYTHRRKADARIALQIHAALGSASTVLNIGAGAGSYEPDDRHVLAVEPSAVMRRQRPASAVPAIHATAERLPFDDQSIDACMTVLSIHHWLEIDKGLAEMRRVCRQRAVVFTYDPDELERFWLFEYLPELASIERARFPSISRIEQGLQTMVRSMPVHVPLDCSDGFNEAFYGRPEAFLDQQVRQSQSAWALLGPGIEERCLEQLERDLLSGWWDDRYGHLRTQHEFVGAIRIVVAEF